MGQIPKFLIIVGVTLIIIGFFWHFAGKNFPLGRLPGDIYIKREGMSFYFPITTCLLISGLISLISYLLK